MPADDADVIVVGAGPGGSAAAHALAQSGLVRVYALAMAVGIAALAAWLITGAS